VYIEFGAEQLQQGIQKLTLFSGAGWERGQQAKAGNFPAVSGAAQQQGNGAGLEN